MPQSRLTDADYAGVAGHPDKAAWPRPLARLARAWSRERNAAAKRVQQLELTLRAAGMGSFEWEPETGRARFSTELEALYGLTDQTFDGTWAEIMALVHDDDRKRVEASFSRAAADREPIEIEFRAVVPGGGVRWRNVTASTLPAEPGLPQRVVGVGRDITERKLAEAALAEAQARYRRLVEQLPLATYLERLDAESAMYISPQIAELVGYTADEWIADPSFFAKRLHPDDRDRVIDAFAAMHDGGEPFDGEYRLIARDGRIVWIHDSAVLVCDDAGAPLYIQGYMIDVTDRREAEEALNRSQAQLRRQMMEIEHQALHDPLTGLPNRALFHARIEAAIEAAEASGGSLAVMMLDLDRFKEVNDTLGHHSGDALLDEVGRRLRAAVRASDTVARLGGDEFGILAPGVSGTADAVRLAEKLAERIARPIELGDLTLEVEASVGIAFHPDHGTDVGTLIRHADVAMYLSKERHHPALYAPEHDQHSRARLTAVSDLRRALERDELVVHYQPQADATSRAVRRVEALVRWQHPEEGLIAPHRFIPLAERTDLIRQVTLSVLAAALRQHSIWRLHGLDLPVAVNVAGRDLLDLQFPDEVAKLLGRWNVAPAALELEIAENTILTNLTRARDVLERLDALGVRLAIDDFGTGHSSLAHLARLPIDVLKIDRSFVHNMAADSGDAVIVRSIIDLAHNLGLEVIAEGVETEQAAQTLEGLGCDILQGFLLARPAPAEEVAHLVAGPPRPRRRAA